MTEEKSKGMSPTNKSLPPVPGINTRPQIGKFWRKRGEKRREEKRKKKGEMGREMRMER